MWKLIIYMISRHDIRQTGKHSYWQNIILLEKYCKKYRPQSAGRFFFIFVKYNFLLQSLLLFFNGSLSIKILPRSNKT